MAVIDVAGYVTELKDHAVDHGFHVHDERHFVETYSLRQAWEVDLHPGGHGAHGIVEDGEDRVGGRHAGDGTPAGGGRRQSLRRSLADPRARRATCHTRQVASCRWRLSTSQGM